MSEQHQPPPPPPPSAASLARRARHAARVDAGAGPTREFLAFDLANERYALPLGCVREIMRVPPVTEVPRGPEEVLGVISARGSVTTLIDLRKKLKLFEAPLGTRARVLLVALGEEVVGLLVDAVLQVHRLAEDEIELAATIGGGAPTHLIGIGRPDLHVAENERAGRTGELLLLLDPNALLEERGAPR